MARFYEKQKDDDKNALDFLQVKEAQQAAMNVAVGATTSPLPYDVEKKVHIDRQIEQEQRPK